jgi:copper chaperone NosL
MITDQRYGAEIVTNKGKIFKYDAIECLAASYIKVDIQYKDIHSLWVVDFGQPQKLIEAESTVYLRSKDLHSPMGLNISAFSSKEMAEKVEQLYIGEILSWEQVKKMVKENWMQK